MYSNHYGIFHGLSEISTDDDIIDIILSELNKAQRQCRLFDEDNDFLSPTRIHKIVKLIQHHNLAEILGQSFQHKIPLIITDNGTYISNQGGWIAYNLQVKQKDNNESQLRLQEVQASMSSADAGVKSMRAAYLAIFISTAFALWQFWDGSNKQTEIDVLKIKVRALDSLSLFQLQLPKPKTHHLDSTLKHKVSNGIH